jgi:hypothetical protein
MVAGTGIRSVGVLVAVSQHSLIHLHPLAEQLVATTAGHPLPAPIRRALGQVLRARHRA